MPKTPQEIVNAAYTYMQAVMVAQASKISNTRVEELVRLPSPKGTGKEAKKTMWNVVVSYDIAGDFPFDRTREYKQFTVTEDGDVLDMKIKKI